MKTLKSLTTTAATLALVSLLVGSVFGVALFGAATLMAAVAGMEAKIDG